MFGAGWGPPLCLVGGPEACAYITYWVIWPSITTSCIHKIVFFAHFAQYQNTTARETTFPVTAEGAVFCRRDHCSNKSLMLVNS